MIITEVAGVNWVLPNFNDEYGEVAEAHGKMGERYHAHFPNQETWSSKARLGSKQQVQPNWNVKNTGAFDGTPIDKNIHQIGFFTKGEPSIEFKNYKKNKLWNNAPFRHF